MAKPEFHIIPLDLYTNLKDTLEMLAGALWGEKKLGSWDPEGGAPSSILSLAEYNQKARLTPEEADLLLTTVKGITDFWITLGVQLPVAFRVSTRDAPMIYRVTRPDTEGKPALEQTIQWLRRRGIKNPIVWNDYQVEVPS